MQWLKDKVNDSVERLGFILKDGSHVECKNVAENPRDGGLVSSEDLMEYYPRVVASWHTHVGSCNLSGTDFLLFQSYPDWDHYIAGDDGIMKYNMEDGDLVQERI